MQFVPLGGSVSIQSDPAVFICHYQHICFFLLFGRTAFFCCCCNLLSLSLEQLTFLNLGMYFVEYSGKSIVNQPHLLFCHLNACCAEMISWPGTFLQQRIKPQLEGNCLLPRHSLQKRNCASLEGFRSCLFWIVLSNESRGHQLGVGHRCFKENIDGGRGGCRKIYAFSGVVWIVRFGEMESSLLLLFKVLFILVNSLHS